MRNKDRQRQRTQQQLLNQAYADYLHKVAELQSIHQCPSWWVDGETRCDLDARHDGPHRHRPLGSPVGVGVITWPVL